MSDEVVLNPREKGLGRVKSLDVRDFGFRLMAAPPPAGLYKKLWSPGKRLDQGSSSSCVGHSVHKYLTMPPVINSPSLNPYQIYGEAQKVDEWPGEGYDGTSVRAGFKVAQKLGYVASYGWAFDIKTVVNYVLRQSPMVFGTIWLDSMFDPFAFGGKKWIKVDIRSGMAGGHAYVISGIDKRLTCPDGTVGAARILNSWGEAWGDLGQAYISLKDLEVLLLADGEACTALEI